VSEGWPQRYGTQYDWSDDGAAMVPMVGVEAPESLAERRAAVGLAPMVWRHPPPCEPARRTKPRWRCGRVASAGAERNL